MNYLSILLLLPFSLFAQVSTDSELYQIMLKKDSILFEAGFNRCNLDALESQLTDDLEFYHDQGGPADKASFLKSMKDNICSSPNRKPVRKRTPGTLKVHALYNNGVLYGAIVEGKHEFFIKEPNKELYKTSAALFSGLWILEEEEWKIKRVFSYDHKGPN